ncbi:MAG: AI-2E family transporter [Candidatus Obscuribacterales bacterium]
MNKNSDLSIEAKAIRVTLVVLTAALIVWLSYQLRIVIIDVLLAVIIAAAIAPVADKAEIKKIPRTATVAAVYIVVTLFYAGVGLALSKPLREQADLFKQHLPRYHQQVNDVYEQLKERSDEWANQYAGVDLFEDEAPQPAASMQAPPEPQPKPRKLEPGKLQDVATRIARETLSITAGLFGALLNAVLVLFLAAYFVVEAKVIWNALLQWVPPDKRERARGLIDPLGYRMGGYVRGQVLVSTAVAAVFAVGFTVINLQYSFVLAIMAGLFNLIPFVGSMLITVLAVLIAANTGGPILIALTLVVFACEQFLESNFIVPHLLGKQVDMHPLLVLLAILVGGTLAGALGAIVAVPVTSALLYLAQEFYVKPINETHA